MNWNTLEDPKELETLKIKSAKKPQVIFKHSTACGTSHYVKELLEEDSEPEGVDFHLLDLREYTNISAAVSRDFSVRHESPQLLLIRNGKCIYHKSHSYISMQRLKDALQLHNSNHPQASD